MTTKKMPEDLPYYLDSGLLGKEMDRDDRARLIRIFETIIRASQGNFDHLSAQARRYATIFNKLADEVVTLGERSEGASSALGGHTHDGATGEGGSVDHGGLAGLTDDDHPQYANLSQAETFTEALTVSGGTVARDRLNLGADVAIFRRSADALESADILFLTGPAAQAGLEIQNTTQFRLLSSATLVGIQMWKDATPTKAVNIGMNPVGSALTDDIVFSMFNGVSWTERMRLTQVGKLTVGDELEVDGALNHDGTTAGFYGVAPVAQAATIVDADGTLADITTKFNSLLAKLEAVGLLASV